MVEYKSDFKLWKYTPYLILMGELWGYIVCFSEKIDLAKKAGTVLWHTSTWQWLSARLWYLQC